MNDAPLRDEAAPAPSGFDAVRQWWYGGIGAIDRAKVVERVDADAGWSSRYAFMIIMSAGIAVLGLLLSSPAVVIGAMLISPLMGPILGLGFALAIFDWREVRRSVVALAAKLRGDRPEELGVAGGKGLGEEAGVAVRGVHGRVLSPDRIKLGI